MPDESSRKRVPRPGRIHNILERQGWRKKDFLFIEQQRAVFALLDHEHLGPHLEHLVRCPNERMFAGQLAGLFVIDGQHVHAGDDGLQRLERNVHPKIHGVHHHQLRFPAQLIEHRRLDAGVEVAEHDKLRPAVGFRHDGLEVGEDIELGRERVTRIHVVVVLPSPVKALLPHPTLEAFGRDAATFEVSDHVGRKVLADDGDQGLVFNERTGAQTNIRRSSPHNFSRRPKGRFNAIKGNSTNHNQTHGANLPCI